MKVLFIIGSVGHGGHARSALTIARALAARGTDVHVAAGDGKGIEIVKTWGLSFTVLPTGFKKGHVLERKTFLEFGNLADSFKPEAIHAFDFNGLILGGHYALKSNCKLIFTICGGNLPRTRIPHMKPIVVFSRELQEGMNGKNQIPPDCIYINYARINLEQKTLSKEDLMEYKKHLDIKNEEDIVMTISRIGKSKLDYLLHFIETADQFNQNRKAVFLIVGAADDPDSLDMLKNAIDKVNRKHGRSVVVWTDKGCDHAMRLLPLAKIAVGLARTAYEAMNLGIPTLVIGKHGFAGVADLETCDFLAEANFSGRNAKHSDPDSRSPHTTAKVLQQLFSDNDLRNRVGEEGQKWVRENLDVSRGAEFYQELYSRDALTFYKKPTRIELFHMQARDYFFRAYRIVPERTRLVISEFRRRGKPAVKPANF